MAMRWYSVSVLSNYEKKVAESIRHQAEQEGLVETIEQVLVPTEEVIEMRRGKKVQMERRFMPGYVLVRMDMEVARILQEVEEGAERPRPLIHFEVGENVNVNDGPFEGFAGMVEDVDEENARLKVTVSIFGRATPVELEFAQVTKQT